MREKAIIETLSITKKGQIKHFQVRIPNNAERVIGIETGLRMISSFSFDFGDFFSFPTRMITPFPRNLLIGELKLQSCDEGNLFYTGEIHVRDFTTGYGDFSETEDFRSEEWTHGLRREEMEVVVKGDTTILTGFFRDRIGELFGDVQYEIKVIVWYEVKVKKDDCQPCS